MKRKITLIEKITLLNKTILLSMAGRDKNAVVRNFTENGIKILGADFGFAWWKFSDADEYRLAYKSPSTPYKPFTPREKASHYTAIKTKKPLFDTNVKKENYGSSDISPYMKSFIIIPIYHEKYVYGSITLCYKKRHTFTKEELTLSEAIGNTTAQAITIHALMKTDALLREERLKTEFIANAAHELRTPLAIMKGSVYLGLADKKNLKSARKALQEVNTEISALSAILRDLALLTISTKNAVQINDPAPVNLGNLLQKLAKRMTSIASEKNIKIRVRKTKNLLVAGNEVFLTKLFINLIKNAISYGRKNGNVILSLSPEGKKIKIRIADNGMGISKEDLPKIFDRFYRGDKAHTQNHTENHSGLGLTIARWATEIHGGTIEVQSTLGKGSTFTVTLPKLVRS